MIVSTFVEPKNYLLFLTKPYSVAVLEPVAKAISKMRAGHVKWFAAGAASKSTIPGEQLFSTKEVLAYNPDAVIVPGNIVPDFWPGLKVQIFHGLGEEKKGHYRITGFFDLYCTPGPFMTDKFQELAEKKKTFIVRETGWSKLDKMDGHMDKTRAKQNLNLDPNRPVLLYSPTFSPKYSSAPYLFEEIKKLNKYNDQWIIKFHDLQDRNVKNTYSQLNSNNIHISVSDDILPLMQASDLLITDTSSVAYEYLLLDRPIITFRAVVRKDKGIDITSTSELHGAIVRSMNDPKEFAENRKYYLKELHPYQDGKSSERVLAAIHEILENHAHSNLSPKPKNWFRKRQIRKVISG